MCTAHTLASDSPQKYKRGSFSGSNTTAAAQSILAGSISFIFSILLVFDFQNLVMLDLPDKMPRELAFSCPGVSFSGRFGDTYSSELAILTLFRILASF